MKLQKELQQADRMITGYQEANQKAEQTNKQLSTDISALKKELQDSKKKVHELEIKALVNKEEVYIEKKSEDVDLVTQNLLGQANTMTQSQLKELHEKLRKVI